MASNPQAQDKIRQAFADKDAQAFSDWVLILLGRGYATRLGARGGISFKWVGAGQEDIERSRQEMAKQFAAHFGKR